MISAILAFSTFPASISLEKQYYPSQEHSLVFSFEPSGKIILSFSSSAAGCVTTDIKLGKWAYWGWLKDVSRGSVIPAEPENDQEGDEKPMAEAQYATVIAESGSTVNMRTKAETSAALVERVPIGARVEVLGTVGSWAKVKFGSRNGYMMT